MTESKEIPSPLVQVQRWRDIANAWLHLADTWQQLITACERGGIPTPPGIEVAMHHQADQLMKALVEQRGMPIVPSSASPSRAEPVDDRSHLERIRSILASKSSRAQDLAEITGLSKESVEHLLTSRPDLFERTGDRGWWRSRQ